MLSELVPEMKMPVDVAVSGLTDDSRRVSSGCLFIAVPGMTSDGRTFIADAIERKAAAIFCEPPVPGSGYPVPVIEVAGLGEKRGEIASRFFDTPSEHMLVIGVTGTNGKTSCSHFVASALGGAGRVCGIIGTLGFGLPGGLREPGLTTPDAIELQRRLAGLLHDGCDAVCLEASSHGLAQGRLNGTAIDIGVFTNITRDHLDYHDTFTEYKRAKRMLFEWPRLKAALINLDDDFAGELTRAVADDVQVLTYSATDRSADVHCSSVEMRVDGFDMEVQTPWGNGSVSSGLLGGFNVSNLLAVISILGLLEYDITEAMALAGKLRNVPGRMDALRHPGMPLVVIDYAHTPDALEKALRALRNHCKGRLWCVMGCGGDRDKGKRPLMGGIVAALADRGIVTDDNPRSESPAEIIKQVLAGAEGDHVQAQPGRAEAIRMAIEGAAADDIVLIAGKGHEDYQEVDGERLPFSDYVEVEKLFAGR